MTSTPTFSAAMGRAYIVMTICALAPAGCAAAPEPGPSESRAIAAQAPHLGKADGSDQADRECRVVLREVGRTPASDGDGYAQKCVGGACNWVFTGHVDVSMDAFPTNATVGVLYHLQGDSSWWQVTAAPAQGARPGFYSQVFEISEHLIGPNASADELASARIELIPFLKLEDGTRVFDHNRRPGDLDVYSFGQNEWFALGEEQACQPVAGTLFFQEDWQENVGGSLHAGGWLSVYYDLDRLPECRGTHNGYPAWDTVATLRFLPSGETVSGSVRDFVTNNGTPTNQAVEKRFDAKIPDDATAVEVWFENSSGAGNNCDTWDSNYGQNYRFDILPAVDDPRCQDVESWSSYYGGSPTCTAYTVDENYDATSCEFWLEGLGDGYEGHYGIPFNWLEAYVHVGAQDGKLLNVGMLTHYDDAERVSLGKAVGDGVWETGFTYKSTGIQSLPSYSYGVQSIAFFIDVERPSGKVVRLWQSRGGQNYSWDDAFGAGTTTKSIPYGNVKYAVDGATVFDQKHTCQ
jgi:hypothetical protein